MQHRILQRRPEILHTTFLRDCSKQASDPNHQLNEWSTTETSEAINAMPLPNTSIAFEAAQRLIMRMQKLAKQTKDAYEPRLTEHLWWQLTVDVAQCYMKFVSSNADRRHFV